MIVYARRISVTLWIPRILTNQRRSLQAPLVKLSKRYKFDEPNSAKTKERTTAVRYTLRFETNTMIMHGEKNKIKGTYVSKLSTLGSCHGYGREQGPREHGEEVELSEDIAEEEEE